MSHICSIKLTFDSEGNPPNHLVTPSVLWIVNLCHHCLLLICHLLDANTDISNTTPLAFVEWLCETITWCTCFKESGVSRGLSGWVKMRLKEREIEIGETLWHQVVKTAQHWPSSSMPAFQTRDVWHTQIRPSSQVQRAGTWAKRNLSAVACRWFSAQIDPTYPKLGACNLELSQVWVLPCQTLTQLTRTLQPSCLEGDFCRGRL